MKILSLGDITWELITLDWLIAQIEKLDPSLILLTGDLVDDKWVSTRSRTAMWRNVGKLLRHLSESRIQTFFVQGNWDFPQYYAPLARRRLRGVRDITGHLIEHEGLRILGIGHSQTKQLQLMRRLRSTYTEPLDIVLAHAEGRRRIWFFDLPARLVITGHYDRQLCQVDDKVFISMFDYPTHYVTIDYKSRDRFNLTYYDAIKPIEDRWQTPRYARHSATFTNADLIWRKGGIAGSDDYGRRITALMDARRQLLEAPDLRRAIGANMLAQGVPKRWVEEYLARPRRPVE